MSRTIVIAVALWAALAAGSVCASVDSGVIRLGGTDGGEARGEAPEQAASAAEVHIGAARQGFDYSAFQARVESLWFERKTLLARGRDEDAQEQLERIRASCAEEGVRRLDHVAGALVAEARRDVREGSYARAAASLQLAAALDPDRPQVHLLQASVLWKAERAPIAAVGQLAAALKATLLRSIRDLSLFHQLAFLAAISLVGGGLVFALAMLVRHQAPLRHEVEEWTRRTIGSGLARASGWAVLMLPLMTWIGAGWATLWWILISFRFMRRPERMIAVGLLVSAGATFPVYRVCVSLFGAAADPAVRTTMLSVGGEYDPDRIVRLRELVDAHPDDPVYRFLLAGLYKNGRYFEEAFSEYRRVLAIDPGLEPAYINVGNIFYSTGQYGEAIVNYQRAIELDPRDVLGHFNMHLAQSEDFRFSDAEESLRAARAIDAQRVAGLLTHEGERPVVQDASLQLASIWETALDGRNPLPGQRPAEWRNQERTLPLLDPIGISAVIALVGCAVVGLRPSRRETARCCIRCGVAFCSRCRRGRKEGREYCTQCLHLFVLGDGLAPAAKEAKLQEIKRHERRWRRLRRLSSLVLPGAGDLLRGRAAWGLTLSVLWIASVVAVFPALALAAAKLVGLDLQPELLAGARSVPVSADTTPLALLAIPALPLVWLAGNLGLRRADG